MRRFTQALSLVGLLLLQAAPSLCAETQVENLSGGSYAPSVAERLRQARRSIVVSMYRLQASEGAAGGLLKELQAAHARGVQVAVYLDREEEAAGFNAPAAQQLESRGIPVFWDPPDRMLHVKAVLIDGEWTILGSHNWTEAALTQNAETSVAIHSKDLAAQMLGYLDNLPWQKGPLAPTVKEAVPLEMSFLTDPRLFGRMVTVKDESALDLWLWLRSHFVTGRTFHFDYDIAARGLGLVSLRASRSNANQSPVIARRPEGPPKQSRSSSRTAGRRRLNRLLRKLETYGLLEFHPQFNRDAEVVLKPLDSSQGTFGFPKDYWRYRWREALSFSGKACLLITLAHPGRFWEASHDRLSKQFHVGPDFIKNGMNELKRKGVLEIRYRVLSSRADQPPSSGAPQPTPSLRASPPTPSLRGPRSGPKQSRSSYKTISRYRLRGLYDRGALERAFAGLEKRYGAARLKQARSWAAVVYKENDPVAVELLLKEVPPKDTPLMAAAVSRVAAKSPTNPKRRFGYLLQTFRRLRR